MRIVNQVILLKASFCFFLFMYLWVINLEAPIAIPIQHICSVMGLFLLYTMIILYLFYKIWESSWLLRLFYVSLYAILLLSLFSVVGFIVHDVYPRMGILLFDVDKPFNEDKFQVRLIRGFTVINIVAAFMVCIVKMIQYKYEQRISALAMGEKLEDYQLKIEQNVWKSHFLTNIFSTSFGHKLIDDTSKTQTEILDIVQFLEYQFKMHFALVDWEEELKQLKRFIRLISYQYGRKSVFFDNQLRDKAGILVPYDVLLFAVENCLKHGFFSEKEPIVLKLRHTAAGIQFQCTNKIAMRNTKLLDQKGGTGLVTLRAQLDLASFPIDCMTHSDAGYFKLMLHFKHLSHEEGNL